MSATVRNCAMLIPSLGGISSLFCSICTLLIDDSNDSDNDGYSQKRFRKRLGDLALSVSNPTCSAGRASTVRKICALSDLDDISVRIADVAANLAVLRDRLCDELRAPTSP